MNQNTQSSWPPEINPIGATQQLNKQDQYRDWFVGDKFQSYYRTHFNQITTQKNMSGFNIGAFFLGPIWMFYRKMYVYGFIYIGCITVFNLIIGMFNISRALDNGISIGISVALGFLGNTLYKKFVDKRIMLITQTNASTPLEQILKQQGGTNIWIAIILLIVVLGLMGIAIYTDA